MRENKQKGKDQLKLLSVQNTTPPSPANGNLHVSSFTLLKPKSVFFILQPTDFQFHKCTCSMLKCLHFYSVS